MIRIQLKPGHNRSTRETPFQWRFACGLCDFSTRYRPVSIRNLIALLFSRGSGPHVPPRVISQTSHSIQYVRDVCVIRGCELIFQIIIGDE